MGIDRPRTITVKRRTTFLLLVLTSVVLLTLTLSLSGRSYKKVDPVPFRSARLLAERLQEGTVSVDVLVALGMPMLLNALIFVPWGFLLFTWLDVDERPAVQSYLYTAILALGFSSFIEAWQYFLPTRVTDIDDVIWNAIGAVVGAAYAHLRKRVWFAFE